MKRTTITVSQLVKSVHHTQVTSMCEMGVRKTWAANIQAIKAIDILENTFIYFLAQSWMRRLLSI